MIFFISVSGMFKYLLTSEDGLSKNVVQASGEVVSAAAALMPLILQTVFKISVRNDFRSSLSEISGHLAQM